MSTVSSPYRMHVWLKSHCYPGTSKRLGYRDVAHRAGISHVTLYGFSEAHEPSHDQRMAILDVLRDLGFTVRERDLW